MTWSSKGVLFPGSLPAFHRLGAPQEVAALVEWFWIPEWNIAEGHSSRQELLSFPASNLVVQRSGVELAGPTTGKSHQVLTGRGWAVGALLKPAAILGLGARPSSLLDRRVEYQAPELLMDVVKAMPGSEAKPESESGPESRRREAVLVFSRWLMARIGKVSESGLMANRIIDTVAAHPEVQDVGQLAGLLACSSRTLQRLCRRHIGLGPAALMRRRRLQDAAERIRENPGANLSEVAAGLGYADHAHLANDFRRVLGLRPSHYRDSSHGAAGRRDIVGGANHPAHEA